MTIDKILYGPVERQADPEAEPIDNIEAEQERAINLIWQVIPRQRKEIDCD